MFKVTKTYYQHATFYRYLSRSSNQMDVDDGAFKKPVKKHIEEDKARLQWRQPIADRPNEWYSKFKLFAPEKDTNSTLITMFQQPFNLTPSGIKGWYKRKQETVERHMQSFIPERNEILGNDLAAAHFIVHRGGSIKFLHQKDWVKMDENDEYKLPNKFDEKYKVEAIKCDNMLLYYEGLENIRRLKSLKFLSFNNVEQFDDWYLDRVSGLELDALEVLDLSGTQITENGLQALYRVRSLKLLIFDGTTRSKAMELVCAMLEELFPLLKIVEGNTIR